MTAAQGVAGGGDEGVEAGAVGGEDEAGVGAELAGPERQRSDEALRASPSASAVAPGRTMTGLMLAHFRIDRDGLGALRGGLHQGRPGGLGSGESDGLDPGVGGEGAARSDPDPMSRVKVPFGKSGLGDGLGDGACATRSAVPGWASCALTTTGQPAARAEAVSPPAVEKARGKLVAPKTTTGPRGTGRCRMSGRGAGGRSGWAGSMTAELLEPSRRTSGRRGGAGPWCGRLRR